MVQHLQASLPAGQAQGISSSAEVEDRQPRASHFTHCNRLPEPGKAELCREQEFTEASKVAKRSRPELDTSW